MCRVVDVEVLEQPALVPDGQRGDQLVRPPGQRGELVRGGDGVSRLAEDPAVAGDELVAADQGRVGLVVAEAERLGTSEPRGQGAGPGRRLQRSSSTRGARQRKGIPSRSRSARR